MNYAAATDFSIAQRTQIQRLSADLTRRIQRRVSVEYGQDDHGGSWAALLVDSLPYGSSGNPGMLVSILKGTGVHGETAVMASDGSTISNGVSMSDAAKAAALAGVREYRELAQGAIRRH